MRGAADQPHRKGLLMKANVRSSLIWIAMVAVGVIAGAGCESVGLRSMKIYMQQQNWDKALEQGQLATADNPNEAEAWFNLSYVASQLDSFDIMLDAMSHAQELGDTHDDAIHDIKTAEYNELFNRAVSRYNAGELDAATGALTTAVNIQSDRANAHKVLGMVAQRQENSELAIKHYARAFEIDPADTEIARPYSAILANSGDREAAISVMATSYELNPGDRDVVISYVSLLQADGQFDTAIEVMQAALAQEPEDGSYNMTAGILYMGKAQTAEDTLVAAELYAQAMPRFEQAIAADSSNVDAAFNLAMCLRAVGNLDGAAEPLRAAVVVAPDDYQARMQLATVLLQQEQADEAEPHLLQVIEQVGEPTSAVEREVVVRAYGYLKIIYTVQWNDVAVQAQELRAEASEAGRARRRELNAQAESLDQQAQELLNKSQEMGQSAEMYGD